MTRAGYILFLAAVLATGGRVTGEIIDLGHGYRNSTDCWNAMDQFRIFGVVSDPVEGYTMESFTTAEHCGTHIDAPYHFNANGWKLGEIPLKRTVANGVYIDVSNEVNGNGSFLLTSDHIEAWERTNGPLPNRSVVLINFGWAHKFGDSQFYYHGNKNQSSLWFPGLSASAAKWIVDSGKVYGVGVDGPSVDPGTNDKFSAHKILAKANLYNLENVALNGTTLPPKGFKLIVQPVKILEGTGAPCRILAYTDNTFE